MDSPTLYFRLSLLSSIICFFFVLPFSLLISFFVPAFWSKGLAIQSPLFVGLLNLVLTTSFLFYYKISINPKGIKCTDFWGKFHFVEWSTISYARYSQIGGLLYILISTNKSKNSLWLPLFLNKLSLLRQMVLNHAGENNPLAIKLSEFGSSVYLLKEAKNKIELAWIAGVFSGILTLVFIILSQAGYYKLNWLIDIWSLIDVCLVFALSFGIYKKSRICAVAMASNFILNQALLAINFKIMPSLLSLIFLFIYISGIQGAFTYQKLSRE
jgi:hypothetical protein